MDKFSKLYSKIISESTSGTYVLSKSDEMYNPSKYTLVGTASSLRELSKLALSTLAKEEKVTFEGVDDAKKIQTSFASHGRVQPSINEDGFGLCWSKVESSSPDPVFFGMLCGENSDGFWPQAAGSSKEEVCMALGALWAQAIKDFPTDVDDLENVIGLEISEEEAAEALGKALAETLVPGEPLGEEEPFELACRSLAKEKEPDFSILHGQDLWFCLLQKK